ncbi:hypothetical protein BZB76_6216 [Actinomadura pelletieri DSM 43383]|uniref:Uncharacterized protein n=1 Tax=Actinomadura pelletieri DSM 43383 TaxID=1120940 RepID=A0A495QBW6_9ACTN|nr:hypothetical protein [Actinomadura pelletieri]RKS69077.1 hypothetical protein BZB76_6216 [Actinomadura pelletieri DSM 43383]
MGVEQGSGTDTRTENSDKSSSSERPYTPPADNPGSPEQPSRLESRARAREAQQDNGGPPGGERHDKPQTTNGQPRESGKDRDSGGEGGGERPGPRDQQYRDMPGSPGQPSRLESQARAREAQQDNGTQRGETKDSSATAGRDRDDEPAAAQTPEGKDRDSGNSEAGSESGRAEQPATSEWPKRDMPGSPEQPSRLESLARAREAQQHAAQDRQTDGTEPATDREDGPATSRNGEAAGKPEILRQDNDQSEPQKDDGTSDDSRTASGERDQEGPAARTTEADRPQDREHQPLPRQDAPEPATTEQDTRDARASLGDSGETPPEQTGQATDQASPGQPEARPDTTPGDPRPGDHTTEPTRDAEHTPQAPDGDTDHTPSPPDNRPGEQESAPEGQTTDQPTGAQEPGAENDDRGKKAEDDNTEPTIQETKRSGQSGETTKSGKELAPHGEKSTEIEPSRYKERITIPVDSDGKPIPSSRHEVHTDTPGRGELRRPEDDPADRDPRERDPERPRSPRDLRREMMEAGPTFKKDVNETAKPALEQFDARPPKSQPCIGRNISDHINSVEQPLKAGDALVGIIGSVILGTELVRLGFGLRKRSRNKEE